MEDIADHFSVNYFGGIVRSCGLPRTMPEKSEHGPTVPIGKALCAVRLSAASQLFYLIDVAKRTPPPHLAIQPFSASWVASISSSLYRRRGQKKPRKPSPLRRGTMWT